MRAAVIGSGEPGLYHMEAYRRHPGVELRAIWSRRAARSHSVGARFSPPVATMDLDAILNDDQIDLVSLCVPNQLHAELAIRALRAGKHVFCEVPMVSRLEDADDLLAAVEETGRKFYVGQIDRVEPAFLAIKALVDAGDLGTPFLLESTFLGRGWTPKMPADWWGWDVRNPEIVLVSLGCFPVSLLQWVAGPITEVEAYGRKAAGASQRHHDTVVVNLRFESGALGRIVVTESARRPYSIDLSVYGDRGTAINNQLFLERLAGVARDEFIDLPIPLIRWRSFPDETIQGLFSAEIDQFIACIETDTPPAVDIYQGVAIIRTLDAIARSLASGQPAVV
jgi:predicted dehydrogenase